MEWSCLISISPAPSSTATVGPYRKWQACLQLVASRLPLVARRSSAGVRMGSAWRAGGWRRTVLLFLAPANKSISTHLLMERARPALWDSQWPGGVERILHKFCPIASASASNLLLVVVVVGGGGGGGDGGGGSQKQQQRRQRLGLEPRGKCKLVNFAKLGPGKLDSFSYLVALVAAPLELVVWCAKSTQRPPAQSRRDATGPTESNPARPQI